MTFKEFNYLDKEAVLNEMLNCCGSKSWANVMTSLHPFADEGWLLSVAGDLWMKCSTSDWLEAFSKHPRIGDVEALRRQFNQFENWSKGEQAGVNGAAESILNELADYNDRYFEKFGFIFIISASGKSAEEMLEAIKLRLSNNTQKEMKIAAIEQGKITSLRLRKLLSE